MNKELVAENRTSPTECSALELAEQAQARISEFIKESPTVFSPAASFGEARVYIKDETVQHGGSFKDRGAANAVAHHFENGERLFVTASAGNHGRGVARAAQALGAKAVVVVNKETSGKKRSNILQHGAELVVHGNNFDESLDYSIKLAEEREGLLVPPFADELVRAGQSTLGNELLDDNPDMTYLVLPVGGGGLLAGVASVVKSRKKDVKIVAAQVEGNTAFVNSLEKNKPLKDQPVRPSFEGIAVGNVDSETFEIARDLVDETLVLTTTQVYKAIYDFREESKSLNNQKGTLLEFAGAVGPAAARRIAFRASEEGEEAQIVTVATGANPSKAMGPFIDAQSLRHEW